MSSAKPESITGGCLCASIRYTVNFPTDHDFASACGTCQCSQCRKNTGSLIFRVQALPDSAVRFTADGTLKRYHASSDCSRGFCAECGSFVFWKRDGTDRISLTVGCFDKEVLRKYGAVLTTAKKHEYCDDEIVGVTDHLQGEKWRYDSSYGVRM